ncbi:hypothetical protein [Seleniivibrio woodruffii]|uniref:hypothetical protein n=1 Tax=Seleniivibrio woodruffii TaxID=1078050 RepID=UPI0024093D98|nr:hypothetical protein [Seleniivibrio woodruffii]
MKLKDKLKLTGLTNNEFLILTKTPERSLYNWLSEDPKIGRRTPPLAFAYVDLYKEHMDFVLKVWKERLDAEITVIKRNNNKQRHSVFKDADEIREFVQQLFGDMQDEFMLFLYYDFERREDKYRDGVLYCKICDLRGDAESEVIEYCESLHGIS